MGIANSDVSFFMSPLSRVLIGLIPHLMDARPSCISVERAALYRGAMFQTALCRILQPFLELWTKVLSVLTSALMFWLQGFEMNHPKKPEKRIRVLFALTMMKLDYKEAESVYGFFHTWNGCRGCVWCMSRNADFTDMTTNYPLRTRETYRPVLASIYDALSKNFQDARAADEIQQGSWKTNKVKNILFSAEHSNSDFAFLG
jgi:hypothetical protein